MSQDETTAKLHEIAENIGQILNTLEELKTKVNDLFDTVSRQDDSAGSGVDVGGGVDTPAGTDELAGQVGTDVGDGEGVVGN